MRMKLLSLLLCFVCVFGNAVSVQADEGTWLDHKALTFASGTGTQEDPYCISNASELALLANYTALKNEHYNGAWYRLTKDIDLSAHEWYPISAVENGETESDIQGFCGVFDGDGHTISNMKITNGDLDISTVGLFGFNRGTIKNLRLKDAKIQFEHNDPGWYDDEGNTPFINVGGITGCSFGEKGITAPGACGNLQNCFVENITIDLESEMSVNCGALCGTSGFGSVDEAGANGEITVTAGKKIACGGLIGAINSEITVNKAYFTGDIYTESAGYINDASLSQSARQQYHFAGGFCGGIMEASSDVVITDSYAVATLISRTKNGDQCTGGFAGSVGQLSGQVLLENLYCNGHITAYRDFIISTERNFWQGSGFSKGQQQAEEWAYTNLVRVYDDKMTVYRIDETERYIETETLKPDEERSFFENVLGFDPEIWDMHTGALPTLKVGLDNSCDHVYGKDVVLDPPDCTHNGVVSRTCTICTDPQVQICILPKTGHGYDEGIITTEPAKTQDGIRTYTCIRCGDKKTEKVPYDWPQMIRISGNTRYETSYAIADKWKNEAGASGFSTVIIASGNNFPDALTGSFLAAKKEAPLLMVNDKDEKNIQMLELYVKEHLEAEGKVYILGGNAAVSETVETAMNNCTENVKRLAGENRYETNMKILEEAGVEGEKILVCTGADFADSLSASATGLPILLVDPAGGLSEKQKMYLSSLEGNEIYIVGGTGAVDVSYDDQLEAYDQNGIDRIAGDNRYQTSVKVAETFFPNAEHAVIAYAWNFPDGLCGGPYAFMKQAPLILTGANTQQNPALEAEVSGAGEAAGYFERHKIKQGTVLGGTAVLSEHTVNVVIGKE